MTTPDTPTGTDTPTATDQPVPTDGAATVSDEDVDAQRQRVDDLRQQVADAERERDDAQRANANAIAMEQLKAEEARLTAQLEEARRLAGSVNTDATNPITSATESREAAEAQAQAQAELASAPAPEEQEQPPSVAEQVAEESTSALDGGGVMAPGVPAPVVSVDDTATPEVDNPPGDRSTEDTTGDNA